jgi:hypothetical protein
MVLRELISVRNQSRRLRRPMKELADAIILVIIYLPDQIVLGCRKRRAAQKQAAR